MLKRSVTTLPNCLAALLLLLLTSDLRAEDLGAVADQASTPEETSEARQADGAVVGRSDVQDDPWLNLPATGSGIGDGRTVVFITAEEEYRTEESFPMLARILARNGFDCTVLFAVDRDNGTINPNQVDNIPGLEKLASADLAVMALRWRMLPDDQMKHIIDYTNSGKPIVSVRTNTHPFNYEERRPNSARKSSQIAASTYEDVKDTPYREYSWQDGETGGGWGRAVTGETWVRHYGKHAFESTRAVPAYRESDHPVLRGVTDVWGPSDVYGLELDIDTIEPLLIGLVVDGMQPNDPIRPDREATPVAWLKTYEGKTGNTTRVMATTMGAGQDFDNESLRRMVLNSVLYLLDLEVPKKLDVTPVDPYHGRPFGFNDHLIGRLPKDA